MASFGAQASLVADSPYYKLLIGRMLGYEEDCIHQHIAVSKSPFRRSILCIMIEIIFSGAVMVHLRCGRLMVEGSHQSWLRWLRRT